MSKYIYFTPEEKARAQNTDLVSLLRAQILNMQAMVSTFERSCEMAAMKDDGKISRDEEKQLKKIKAAVQAFQKELDKAKNM